LPHYHYLDAGDGEVWNLKADVYWRPTLRVVGDNTRQSKVSSHQEVLAARERLDRPDDRVGLGRVAAAAGGRLEAW